MSEGRSSPATFQEQRRPTRHHINLLHEIILRAQQDPLVGKSPKDALLNAYSATFEEHHLDVLQDSVCFWTLLKVIDPGVQKGSLYEKFEHVLKDEGIELSFDDDASQHGTVFSTTASISPVRLDIPRHRPGSQQFRSHAPMKAVQSVRSWQQQGSAASQATVSSHGAEDKHDYEAYMEHPPPHIVEMMRVAEAMDRRTLIRQSLAMLRPRNLVAMEYQADTAYEGRLKDRVIHQWRSVKLEYDRDLTFADALYEKKVKRAYLRKILDAARIQRIKAMDEERLKGMALYKMTLATREAQFRRKVDMKIKARYLQKMALNLRSTLHHQNELETILQNRQAESNLSVLKPAMEAMCQATRKASVLDAISQEYNETKLKSRSLTKIYDKTRNVTEMRITADEARWNFLMRKYLHKLRFAASLKRHRRIVLAKWALSRWRSFLEVKKHGIYDINYRQIRKTVKMNLARGLLHRWADRTRQIREMEEKADQMYAAKLKRNAHQAIVSMYESSQQNVDHERIAAAHADKLAMKHAMQAMTAWKDQIVQMGEVAVRFQTLHNQQAAFKCLKQLSMKSFEVKRRERDAEAFIARHGKKVVRITWEKMRLVAAQRRSEEPLKLPPATPAQRRAEEINKLTSTTPLYTPASRLSFAARLRGDGVSRNDRVGERIVEESEPSSTEPAD